MRYYSMFKAMIKNAPMFIKFWQSNVKYGQHIRTYNGSPVLKIEKGCIVTIGKQVSIQNHLNTGWYARTTIVVRKDGTLNIGDYTGLNSCMIYCSHSITIGKHVDIGGGTRIYDTNFHDINWEKRRAGETGKSAPVVIGDDVFIGIGCIIGKGVNIGNRSVIAAGSVVVKDIPEDCIAGGNPCKVIKQIVNA